MVCNNHDKIFHNVHIYFQGMYLLKLYPRNKQRHKVFTDRLHKILRTLKNYCAYNILYLYTYVAVDYLTVICDWLWEKPPPSHKK